MVIRYVDVAHCKKIFGKRTGLSFLQKKQTKLRGLSPHANYTDRAAAAGRRS